MFLYLLIVSLFAFFVFIFFPEFISNINKHDITKEYFLENLDNGDLLFFSGKTRGEKSVRFWTRSYFSHVALVIKEDDELYLWESDIGQGGQDGPRVIKLEQKLRLWKGESIIGWKRFIGERPSSEEIIQEITKYMDKEIDLNCISWIFPFYKSEKVFCSQLIIDTLKDLDMINTEKESHRFSPQDLVKLNSEYSYISYILI